MASFNPTIIIVNYNASTMLKACLEALLRQTHQQFGVVVVDNASGDDSLLGLPEDARIHIVKNSENRGFAAANNQVAMHVASEWIITLNPDTEATATWLEELGRAAARYPDFDMFGSTQINAKNPELADGLGDEYFCSGIAWRKGNGTPLPDTLCDEEMFGACAAAAMYRTSRFKKLGGFAEEFFCYMEDVDLAFRFRLNGAKVMQLAAARVFHHGYAVSGVRSDFTLYHCTRNMIWTYFRCMPLALLLLTLPLHLGMQSFILLWAVKKRRSAPVRLGIREAWEGLAAMHDARQNIQQSRKISLIACARMMVWNPLEIIRWRKRVARRDLNAKH